MVWDSCEVFLYNCPSKKYLTGSILVGTVSIEIKNKKKIESFLIKAKGTCKAQWVRPSPTIPYIKMYSEKVKVLDESIEIFRAYTGKVMPAGKHLDYFHLALPYDLPSTFSSSFGKVTYTIEIKAKSDSFWSQKKIIPIKVVGNVNLNSLNNILVPSYTKMETIFWNSGHFSMYFKTYYGFSPHQTIPFESIIINEQKAKMSKITVGLIQKVKYNVHSGYFNEEKCVAKVIFIELNNSPREEVRFDMCIPDINPSSIHLISPIIDVTYVLRVEVCFTYHLNLIHDIPVTIAAIPVIHDEFDSVQYK